MSDSYVALRLNEQPAAASVSPPVVGIRARRENAQALHEGLMRERDRAIWKDQLLELSQSDEADRDQKLAELKKDIRTKLTKSFDDRQAKQTQRVEGLEQRLAALKKSVEEQKKNRERIVDEQLEEVFGATVR